MEHKPIPLAGVIGFPASLSKSPRLHTHWLRTYGLRGHYVPLEIKSDKLEFALRTLPDLGFVGANVTSPHKEAVLKFADYVTDRAAIIGAANTIIFRSDGGVHADNTDGYGFINNLTQSQPDWDPKKGAAAVLGAGGAARGVISALLDAGVPEIRVANRTRHRAQQIRESFGPRILVDDWSNVGNMIEGAATLINTTVLGMEGQAELRIPMDALNSEMLVTDIVYAPLETELLKNARAKGCKTVDGLGMLLHQAVPGFHRWFGVKPEVTDATRRAVLSL